MYNTTKDYILLTSLKVDVHSPHLGEWFNGLLVLPLLCQHLPLCEEDGEGSLLVVITKCRHGRGKAKCASEIGRTNVAKQQGDQGCGQIIFNYTGAWRCSRPLNFLRAINYHWMMVSMWQNLRLSGLNSTLKGVFVVLIGGTVVVAFMLTPLMIHPTSQIPRSRGEF